MRFYHFLTKTTRHLIAMLMIASIAFSLLLSLPLASSANPPQPTYGTAVVDGNPGEWDLTNDFFANMYRAGQSDKPLESKAYLRYDCSSQTLYVLVLTEPGVLAIVSAEDAWAAINTISNKTFNGNDNGGVLPNFAWVSSNGTHALGYEAAFNLAQGSFTIIIHIQVYDDNEGQTSATVGFPQNGVPLVISCPAANPAIQVNKLISTDNASWNEANTPPGILVTAGSNLYYQFIVTNIGNVELANLTLTDNTYTLTNLIVPGTLAPDATFTYYLGPIQAQVGQHANTATATGDYNNTSYSDTDDANYNASPAPNPSINVIKQISTDNSTWANADTPPGITVYAGAKIYYRFIVTNTGNVELSNITLTDNTYTLNIPLLPSTLAPDASFTYYFGPVQAQAGQHTNTATATGQYNNITYSDTDDANYNVAVKPCPSIRVIKWVSTDNTTWVDANTAPGLKVVAGTEIYFKFDVTNTGNVPLTSLTLKDNTYTLPNLNLPASLAPNETYTYYLGPLTAQQCQHTDIATATGKYNNRIFTDCDKANYYGTPPPRPCIQITKYISANGCNWLDANSPPGLRVQAGKCIYYKFVVKNTGNVALNSITIIDNPYMKIPSQSIPLALEVGKSFCITTGPFKACPGLHFDNATASGIYNGITCYDSDVAYYYGTNTRC